MASPASLSHGFSRRSQVVRIGCNSSNPSTCLAGVPQGSVLGPLLFSVYISPIAHIAQAHGIQQQQYADDTQLYVALSPNSMVTHVAVLESCFKSLQAWFCANNMTLNAGKSNATLFVTTQRAQSLPTQVSVNISGVTVTIPLSNHVEILGVVLDPRTYKSRIQIMFLPYPRS